MANGGFDSLWTAVRFQTIFKDVAFDGSTIYTFNDLGELRDFICRHPSTSADVRVVLRKVARNSSDSPVFFHMANLIVRKYVLLAVLAEHQRSVP